MTSPVSSEINPKLMWTFRLGLERNVGARPPVFGDGFVYQVFHYDKKSFFESILIAFDIDTGSERWRSKVNHVLTKPVIGPDGNVYASSFSGNVLAYDKEGRSLWSSPDAGRNIGAPCFVSPDRIVVAETGGLSNRTWCLDAMTGEVVWTFNNGGHSGSIVATTELVVHSTVVRGPDFHARRPIYLHALSTTDGHARWSVESHNWLFKPCIVGKRVIVGARAALLGFDLNNGIEVARLDLPSTVEIRGLLKLAEGVVFSDGEKTIHCMALSRKGAFFRVKEYFVEHWVSALAQKLVGEPVATRCGIALLDTYGHIHLLSVLDGRVIGTMQLKTDENDSGGVACQDSYLAAAHGRTLSVFSIEESPVT